MLGVRRSSVSIVAGTLQEAGFITYRRGHIRLLDVAQIEEGACECYGAVKAHYQRLLAKKGATRLRLRELRTHGAAAQPDRL